MAELILVSERPAILPDPENQGWVIYVSVHDAEYLRMRSVWKQRLKAHPDYGSSSITFDRVKRGYEKWKKDEENWYARLKLTPPRPTKPERKPDHQALIACASGKTKGPQTRTKSRVAAYFAANPGASDAQAAAALGITKAAIHAGRSRANKEAKNPRPTQPSAPQRVAAVLLNGPLTSAQVAASTGLSIATVAKMVVRLRHRGFDIRAVRAGGPLVYHLVHPEVKSA
jgi:biotin operon repressor